jgi:hypothetical protein
LRSQYERLEQNQDLTQEAKSRQAQELYEEQRSRIEGKKKATREALIKVAKAAERSATPKPRGELLTSSDPTRLLLAQNEAERILRVVNKRSGNPIFGGGAGAYLKREYARGIELGSVEGAAVCAGTLRAAEELGVSTEEVVGSLRTDSQRELLDNAQRLEYFAELISTAPKPPRSLGKAARLESRDLNRRSAPILVPASGPPTPAPSSLARQAAGLGLKRNHGRGLLEGRKLQSLCRARASHRQPALGTRPRKPLYSRALPRPYPQRC